VGSVAAVLLVAALVALTLVVAVRGRGMGERDVVLGGAIAMLRLTDMGASLSAALVQQLSHRQHPVGAITGDRQCCRLGF